MSMARRFKFLSFDDLVKKFDELVLTELKASVPKEKDNKYYPYDFYKLPEKRQQQLNEIGDLIQQLKNSPQYKEEDKARLLTGAMRMDLKTAIDASYDEPVLKIGGIAILPSWKSFGIKPERSTVYRGVDSVIGETPDNKLDEESEKEAILAYQVHKAKQNENRKSTINIIGQLNENSEKNKLKLKHVNMHLSAREHIGPLMTEAQIEHEKNILSEWTSPVGEEIVKFKKEALKERGTKESHNTIIYVDGKKSESEDKFKLTKSIVYPDPKKTFYAIRPSRKDENELTHNRPTTDVLRVQKSIRKSEKIIKSMAKKRFPGLFDDNDVKPSDHKEDIQKQNISNNLKRK